MNSASLWNVVKRLAGASLLCLSLTAQSAGVSISEFNILGVTGYTVANESYLSSTPVSVFGFAASNNGSSFAYTERRG